MSNPIAERHFFGSAVFFRGRPDVSGAFRNAFLRQRKQHDRAGITKPMTMQFPPDPPGDGPDLPRMDVPNMKAGRGSVDFIEADAADAAKVAVHILAKVAEAVNHSRRGGASDGDYQNFAHGGCVLTRACRLSDPNRELYPSPPNIRRVRADRRWHQCRLFI